MDVARPSRLDRRAGHHARRRASRPVPFWWCVAALLAILAVHASSPRSVRGQAGFPFTIQGTAFHLNGAPVFLNVIAYQPLEPGQAIDGAIRAERVADDLRRLRAYRGGSDPVLLRVYAQPTGQLPVRMPKAFYDGVRDLGFWIVRDIYFDADVGAPDAIARGRQRIDAVIDEAAQNGGLDRIFAWEFGNEVELTGTPAAVIAGFFTEMRNHVKARMAEPGRTSFSNWVTWATWPKRDPLRTGCSPDPDSGCDPVVIPLDYYSFNAYSYDPERMRDHQAGPVTGTPFAGYLAALRDRLPDRPVVVSESGLPDSPGVVGLDQSRLPPLYPSYRRGALSQEQVAEGLIDRYWDARLSGATGGFGVFEWLDEWHKAGDPAVQSDDPEEHFGLALFSGAGRPLRFKLQQDVVRDLFTLRWTDEGTVVSGLAADATPLSPGESRGLHASVAVGATPPVRFRWESSSGRVVGEGADVQFHAGATALGPVTVTVVGIDATRRASRASVTIPMQPGAPSIEILTFGARRSSGRIANVDTNQHKVVLYVETDKYYVQPYSDMSSVWVRSDGYWWSTNHAGTGSPRLHAWVVPRTYDPPPTLAAPPAGIIIAQAVRTLRDDSDNDLLPDAIEPDIGLDRYSDADGDGAGSLDELLAGGSLTAADNDVDGDGLRDDWERRYFVALLYDAGDDPDADGVSNAAEFQRGTHPGRINVDRDLDALPDLWELERYHTLDGTGSDFASPGVTRRDAYEQGLPAPAPDAARDLAEGATSAFFDTRLALLNTTAVRATATLTFLPSGRAPVTSVLDVPAHTRVTVRPKTIPGLEAAEFATHVESDQLLVVDRLMTWDGRAYGAHAETAVRAPAPVWYLAEGSTLGSFNLFYLLQNPHAAEARVRVRYLRPSGAPLEQAYTLPPSSRTNIWVNVEQFPGLGQALSHTDVSAVIEVLSGPPIIVERAMYAEAPGQFFGAGHESAGVSAAATEWILAEGATGRYFDLFILLANPGQEVAEVEATYLLPDGTTVVKPYTVAPTSRFNIWVDHEDTRLADTAVSTTVRSVNGRPIIVERAMWWPDGAWHESHNSPGATATGTTWALAEGEADASRNLETYILVANTSMTPADVRVRLAFEDGTAAERTYPGIPSHSRFNVPVGAFFPEADGRRFGAVVESLGVSPAQIVVERAMYWDVGGQRWAAGTNSLAVKLR